jgi:hypothetical protein
MSNYKGFRTSQAISASGISAGDDSASSEVRTAKLQPVIVQRSLLRTLMKDARRGSIR